MYKKQYILDKCKYYYLTFSKRLFNKLSIPYLTFIYLSPLSCQSPSLPHQFLLGL